MESLHARNVDTVGVHIDPALKTGLSVILHHLDDRAILTHLGAINALRPEQVDLRLFDRARHVHITSYFLQHQLQPALPTLVAEARRRGATVSIDTNWDPEERWNHGLDRVLANTDVFLPNAQEALAIARQPTLSVALDTLAARIPTVAVKLGAEGALARQGDQTITDPGFRVDVVDTTGAGDSFNSGFLYGFLHGWPLADALALACAAGSLSTRAAGGTTAQPTLDEAQRLIRQRAEGKTT
jgi:sugar/nucleoside kinase (ribokinase family)